MITLLKMIMSIMLWDSPLLALKKQASMLCATVETATQQGRESSLCPTASKEMNTANATKSDGSEHWEWVHSSAREKQQHWHQKANLKQPVKEQSYRTSHSICLPCSSHGDQITISNQHTMSRSDNTIQILNGTRGTECASPLEQTFRSDSPETKTGLAMLMFSQQLFSVSWVSGPSLLIDAFFSGYSCHPNLQGRSLCIIRQIVWITQGTMITYNLTSSTLMWISHICIFIITL